MKLTLFKGVAHDLASHLGFEAGFGFWKDMEFPIDRNVLEETDSFDRSCVQFVQSRVPASFDFARVQAIRVKITKKITTNASVTIRVADKTFASGMLSVTGK
ncbi:MAG: hypothetical protein OXR66_01745 [Candidatus Woesearchaeota archaeon]|nr:hypothetical protein [Candidatus Woesearchaeota archaeon]